MARGSLLLALTLAALLAGCLGSPPPAPTPQSTVALERDSFDRYIREITLRVRSDKCEGVGVGSAFALRPGLLVTNRHVVDGARQIEVSTWDGVALPVGDVQSAFDTDLALIRVDDALPQTAPTADDEPAAGSAVTAVGFPNAGAFTETDGEVVDYIEGTVFGQRGRIMRTTLELEPGNSGGAVLNADHNVVGVAFAIQVTTDYGLVIPISTLEQTIDRAEYAPMRPC